MIILNKYKKLLSQLEEKCAEVFENAPEIPCKNKCFECCQQIFPLSFVEAFYISEGLKSMDRGTRRELARKAEKINAKILKKNPLQFEKRGVDRKTALNTHGEFAQFLHEIKTDCPALKKVISGKWPVISDKHSVTQSQLAPSEAEGKDSTSGACLIYPLRNHDCRSMGCSFDSSSGEIVGCFRFAALKNIAPKLMSFSYLYPAKMKLDAELLNETTNGFFTKNLFYLTTICAPFIKDYGAVDWIKFFEEKGVGKNTDTDKFDVVIDI